MKKTYIQPRAELIALQGRAALLTGSNYDHAEGKPFHFMRPGLDGLGEEEEEEEATPDPWAIKNYHYSVWDE